MAGTFTPTLTTIYTNGNASLRRALNTSITVTGTLLTSAIQNVGTAEETLALGDVTPTGYAIFYNLDDTNYVQLGKATGVYVIRLKAGEFALLRLEAWSTIYAKANTAAVDLEYHLFSD